MNVIAILQILDIVSKFIAIAVAKREPTVDVSALEPLLGQNKGHVPVDEAQRMFFLARHAVDNVHGQEVDVSALAAAIAADNAAREDLAQAIKDAGG